MCVTMIPTTKAETDAATTAAATPAAASTATPAAAGFSYTWLFPVDCVG